ELGEARLLALEEGHARVEHVRADAGQTRERRTRRAQRAGTGVGADVREAVAVVDLARGAEGEEVVVGEGEARDPRVVGLAVVVASPRGEALAAREIREAVVAERRGLQARDREGVLRGPVADAIRAQDAA